MKIELDDYLDKKPGSTATLLLTRQQGGSVQVIRKHASSPVTKPWRIDPSFERRIKSNKGVLFSKKLVSVSRSNLTIEKHKFTYKKLDVEPKHEIGWMLKESSMKFKDSLMGIPKDSFRGPF